MPDLPARLCIGRRPVATPRARNGAVRRNRLSLWRRSGVLLRALIVRKALPGGALCAAVRGVPLRGRRTAPRPRAWRSREAQERGRAQQDAPDAQGEKAAGGQGGGADGAVLPKPCLCADLACRVPAMGAFDVESDSLAGAPQAIKTLDPRVRMAPPIEGGWEPLDVSASRLCAVSAVSACVVCLVCVPDEVS
jgi:hypothetical protein